jgi:hypothetical protein
MAYPGPQQTQVARRIFSTAVHGGKGAYTLEFCLAIGNMQEVPPSVEVKMLHAVTQRHVVKQGPAVPCPVGGGGSVRRLAVLTCECSEPCITSMHVVSKMI